MAELPDDVQSKGCSGRSSSAMILAIQRELERVSALLSVTPALISVFHHTSPR
jgi:hypothetical protein